MKWRCRQIRGFTLTELLVVIALVAVLAAMMLGGLARAKAASQRLACLNNLRQWSYLAQFYAGEHEDRLPRKAAMDGINSWEMTGDPGSRDVWYNALPATGGLASLEQYSRTPASQRAFYTDGKLFHCPRVRFPELSATYPVFSLAMNSKLMLDFDSLNGPGSPGSSSEEVCRLGTIRIPAKTALFLDNGIPGEEQLCPFQAPYTGEPKTFANQFPGRHTRGGNIAFGDGHAAFLAGRWVVDMQPTSVFRGRAIYPPGEVIWCADPAQVP